MDKLNLQDLTIIIPAYNEGLVIGKVLDDLLANCPTANIIVINDGSSDNTAEILEPYKDKVEVITHPLNRGYGAALKSGMKRTKTKALIWFDSDGQHQTKDIIKIAKPVIENQLHAVIGKRKKSDAFVLKRAPGKFILKIFSQIVARQRIPDLNCGFRCFRTSVIKRYMHLLPNGFSASSTSTLIMIKRGYKIIFEDITTVHRTGTSSVRIFRDGFRTLNLMFRLILLFDALLFFSAFAFLQFFIGVLYSIYIMVTVHSGFPVLGALAIISGLLVFFMGLLSSQISEMRLESAAIEGDD